MDDLPSIEAAPAPYLPRDDRASASIDNHASFDAGRGCPFQCSFCTIINVQGRKSRRRSPDDIEQLIKQHWAEGIRRFFITDDNFARNKDWEPIFDRLIKIREQDKIDIRLIIQVDTLCHKIPNFIEKARRAGVTRVFIGLENINPANLLAAKKRQNKITEYRKMLLAWKQAGIITYAGYILGFPGDTPESIQRGHRDHQARAAARHPGVLLSSRRLPGSEDHKTLWNKGVWMDPDMNKYDLEHVATRPSEDDARGMGGGLPRGLGDLLHARAPDDDHAPRARAAGVGMSRLLAVLFAFSIAFPIEKLHPLQFGGFRLKYRLDRRPGLPIEPVWAFYPQVTCGRSVQACTHGRRLDRAEPDAARGPAATRSRSLTPIWRLRR